MRREVREETHLEVEDFSYFVSLPNEYQYQGLPSPLLDIFFTGTVGSFAPARALAEVDDLVIVSAGKVNFAEMAFVANEKALRLFVSKQHAGGAG